LSTSSMAWRRNPNKVSASLPAHTELYAGGRSPREEKNMETMNKKVQIVNGLEETPKKPSPRLCDLCERQNVLWKT